MSTPRELGFVMPPEGARHERCWMAWPCREELWGARMAEARQAYAEVAQTIAQFEPVTMIARPELTAEASLQCGQGVSEEVANLSARLQEARARAETIAQAVSTQADLFIARRQEQNEKLDQFRLIGEKVRELNTSLQAVTQGNDSKFSDRIPAFQERLAGLIAEVQALRKSARESRMNKLLEFVMPELLNTETLLIRG